MKLDAERDAGHEHGSREEDLNRVLVGPGYLYRPGEVLLDPRQERRAAPLLRDAGGTPCSSNEELDRAGLRVQRWIVDAGVDIPMLLSQIRAERESDEEPVVVAANTVFAGEPPYHGGPGGPPRSTSALKEPDDEVLDEEAVLAVLDTGWSTDLEQLHPGLLRALVAGPDDVDELDVDGKPGLDTEAGHGTFICGLVRRTTPELRMNVQMVLDPQGWGDDRDIALGLTQQAAPVVNLSLGGYTEDDRPPLALGRALALLGRERVVVAAAGNHGTTRPFWPAAFKHVIAVAALDTTSGKPGAAAFSNRGWWVDACAPGVHLASTFVRGTQDAGAGFQTFEGWACWSGTSFAAPLVAAAVARAVRGGSTPRAAAAALLGGLATLPGLEDFGVWYDPGVDLVCQEH